MEAKWERKEEGEWGQLIQACAVIWEEHPEPAVPTAWHARPLGPSAGLISPVALWLEPFLRGEGHSLLGEGGRTSESGLVLPWLSWGASVSLCEPASSPVKWRQCHLLQWG